MPRARTCCACEAHLRAAFTKTSGHRLTSTVESQECVRLVLSVSALARVLLELRVGLDFHSFIGFVQRLSRWGLVTVNGAERSFAMARISILAPRLVVDATLDALMLTERHPLQPCMRCDYHTGNIEESRAVR